MSLESCSWTTANNLNISCELSSCQWSTVSADDEVFVEQWSATETHLNESGMSLPLFDDPDSPHVEVVNPLASISTSSVFVTSTPVKEKDSVSIIPRTPPLKKGRTMPLLLFYGSTDQDSGIESPSFVIAEETSLSKNADTSLDFSWSLTRVTLYDGCSERCALLKHHLSEYDILSAHSNFSTKSEDQQRQWLFDYLSSHCPNNADGEKDPKKMKFLLCGKEVCLPIWLIILAVSSSWFYSIRKEYIEGKANSIALPKHRPLSPKSCQAIAWLTSLFERIGDKRPDKDGIYLPTCLTEKAIYDRMLDELYKRQ